MRCEDMVIEALEALEQYTVVQLVLSIPVLLVVLMIIKSLQGFRVAGNAPQVESADGNLVLAEALGKMAEAFTGPLQNVANILEGIAASQSRSEAILVAHDSGSAPIRAQVDTIVSDTKSVKSTVESTSQVVNVMSTDLTDIKTQLAELLQITETMSGKLADSIPLSPESLAVMREFIAAAKALEVALPDMTQETPAVLHPISKIEKPGVPVTPKPKEATEGKTE